MIRMTLALLVCIGLTMVMLGQDVDGPQGSDDPGFDMAASAAPQTTRGLSNPTDLQTPERLSLDDEEGAISRALAATVAPDPAPAIQPTVQTVSVSAPDIRSQHYITGNRVNIRSGPSTANPVVDQVVRDQRVEVLDETRDGWLLIRVEETQTEAYIFGRFVAPVNG